MRTIDGTQIASACRWGRRPWVRTVLLGIFISIVGKQEARCADAPAGASGTRHFTEFALSPDGGEIAEVARLGGVGSGHDVLLLSRLGESVDDATILYRGAEISDLRWMSDRAIGFVDSASSRVIKEEDVKTRSVATAVTARGDILDFAVDPSTRRIAYMFRDWTHEDQSRKWVSRKVPDRIGTLAPILPDWALTWERWGGFGVAETGFGIAGGRATQRQDTHTTHFDVHQLAWYGNPARALMVRQTAVQSIYSTSIVGLEDGSTVVDPNRLGWTYRIGGSPSGRLAIAAMGPLTDRVPSHMANLYVLTRDHKLHAVPCLTAIGISGIWWTTDDIMWVEATRSDSPGVAPEGELLAVDWRRNRIVREIAQPKGTLSRCQLDRSRRIAICLAETLTSSGQLIEIDLESGRMESLDALWNRSEQLDFEFKEIFVRNRYGKLSDGFLALPPAMDTGGQKPRNGYPLAVMLYAFDRSFAKDGQWTHAYPVERLVHAGIAVLLLNIPGEMTWRRGDAALARFETLSSPLSTLLAAPAAVRASGVGTGRVMVLGWSWGGLLAAHAVEQSCEFVAAEVGDPADWDETEYSLYNAATRDDLNWIFGGPPDDRYIKNYLAFDPMHSGAPPHAPILFEYVSRNVAEGQYLQEWRASGADVEAFVYHYSTHFLDVPAEAELSRERNLAWAKVNLLGADSVSPETLAKLGLTVPRPLHCEP